MKKILLVDDNEQDRMLYKRFLGKQVGHERLAFYEACSGEEGLALFQTVQPDCVLLDHNLLDTDGLTLLSQLKQLAPPDTLCVVMITGGGNESLAVRALNGGALDYLVKQQFDSELLYRTVLHAIEKNEWRQYMAQYHAQLQTANHQLRDSLAELTETRQQIHDKNHLLTAANEEIRLRNQLLDTTNQQLARINADLDNFVYTASHDLQAPIANIEGLLHALQALLPNTQQAPPVQPILDMMEDAVARFRRTIAHLTEVTQLQQEPTPVAALVDVGAVVRDVCLDLAPLIEICNARIDVQVDTCPALAFAEKNVRSIVYNLLSNALKYRSPERTPHVRLQCYTRDAYFVMTVQDNGLGLNTTNQQKVFAMFQRLHDHVEGSGIGLYMVKKIVENAGGKIEVESTVGVGSTFTVYFPI